MCDEGFYCNYGVDRPQPDGLGNNSTLDPSWCYDGKQLGFGGRCPVGHFCEKGSSFPKPCNAGTYAALEGQSSCKVCPEGFTCLN